MQDQNTNQVHPFERTLGQGPYKFVGFGQIHFSETFGAKYIGPEVERGAGTCAHCSHAIVNIYVVQTGDGKRFGVGSDCIEKCGLPHRELSAVKRAELAHNRELRKQRKAKKGNTARNELAQIMQSHSVQLKQAVHPNDTNKLAQSQRNLMDYAEFCLKNSNDGGIVIVLKRIKSILGLQE